MNRTSYSIEAKPKTASYFGVEVEVIEKFETCSLIRYGDLKVIVDTTDLVFLQSQRRAA
jgi:hypothetical protein